jgi:predicted aspartyl protease
LAIVSLLVATTSATEIPVDLTGRVIVLKAYLNDRGPYRLILDTGATETVLTPATAKALGVRAGRFGTLDSVACGTAVTRHLPVYIDDPPQALSLRLDHGVDYHGILGQSFLKQFTTRIDYRRQTVEFTTNEVKQGVAITAEDRLLYVTGKIDDRGPVRFLIDTGAADSILLPATAQELRLRGEPLPAQPSAALVMAKTVTIGELVTRDLPLIIHTPLHDAGRRLKYQAILGYSFLSRYVVTIDCRRQRMQLSANP